MPKVHETRNWRLKAQRLRRTFRKGQGEFRETYLASVNGAVRIPNGRLWVHDLASADVSGNNSYGAPYQLPIFPGATIDPRPNWKVNVITFKGQEYIHSMDFADMERAGYDPHQLNSRDPSLKYSALSALQDLLSLPRGDDTVRVEPGMYQKADGSFSRYEAGAASPYIDILDEYVPADVDDATIVCLWLDTYTNAISLTQSSEFAQSATIGYTSSEALTYINEAASDRPPDSIGIRAYIVLGDTTTMDITTLFWDLRPFLHALDDIGWSYNLTRNRRIWPNHQQIVYGQQTIQEGKQLIIEDGGQLVILP